MTTTALTKTELFSLAQTIATALGDGWQATDDGMASWYVDLIHEDGRRLMVKNKEGSRGSHTTILSAMPTVKGSKWAFDEKRKERTTRINVAIAKGGDAIARDIERRLLPDLSFLTDLANTMNAETDTYVSTMESMATELASALDGELRGTREGLNFDVHFYETGFGNGHLVPHVQDRGCRVELRNIPFDVALDICKIVRKARDKRRKALARTNGHAVTV